MFFYGNPGDVPFMGDWDCDGVDTPGLFRLSDAFAYLRNSNSQGIADIRATHAHLLGMPECSGKVGAVGFCLGGTLAFACALARQCFINEYVFGCTEHETHLIRLLRDAGLVR